MDPPLSSSCACLPWPSLPFQFHFDVQGLRHVQANVLRCPLHGQTETNDHAVCFCKYLLAAAHIAAQCMGPTETPDGPSTDAKTPLWDKPELSLTTPLGLVPWTATRASWSVRCAAKMSTQQWTVTWDFYVNVGKGTAWVEGTASVHTAKGGSHIADPSTDGHATNHGTTPPASDGIGIPHPPKAVVPTQET